MNTIISTISLLSVGLLAGCATPEEKTVDRLRRAYYQEHREEISDPRVGSIAAEPYSPQFQEHLKELSDAQLWAIREQISQEIGRLDSSAMLGMSGGAYQSLSGSIRQAQTGDRIKELREKKDLVTLEMKRRAPSDSLMQRVQAGD